MASNSSSNNNYNYPIPNYQKNLNNNFHIAVKENNIENVKHFLKNEADFQCKNVDNHTAVFVALISGFYEIFQYLIKLYVNENVNINDIETNGMPLIFAVCKNADDLTSIKILIENGVNVKRTDANQMTPLFFCINHNRQLIFEYLLNLPQIDVNERDKISRLTPLQYACVNQSTVEFVKLLCNHKNIQLNAINYEGETAIYLACRHPQNVEIVKCLIACGCDITICNFKCRSPIEQAHHYKSNEILKLLVHHPQININYIHQKIFDYLQKYNLI